MPGPSRRGEAGFVSREARAVWFYRDYVRLYGGHVKHSHYFGHVRRMPGFAPRIAFSEAPSSEPQARERRRLWPAGDAVVAGHWEPADRDVLFLAGVDWRYLFARGIDGIAHPRINLVQHVRHAHQGTELYRYLAERAIRICVSQEVSDAISATGRVNGPVLTIPNGINVAPFEPAGDGAPAQYRKRPLAAAIIAYKRPDLGRAVSERLDAEGVEHRLVTEFMDRSVFLSVLAESRVVVCLPHAEEGFYLTALEAMACGCIVVTLDCVGNRGVCRHEDNCLLAEPNAESLFDMTCRAHGMSASERAGMHRQARDTAAAHSLEAERARFHAVLGDVDHLWRTG